jgi:biotin carboxylase
MSQSRPKKLMVLGAGPFQIAGIRKAVELGHYVISVDNVPDNLGHRYAHRSLSCSTTHREELAEMAAALAIDGICTFSSDVAVPSVGYLCDRLDLPGVSRATAERMSAKHRFREAQMRAGLPHPAFMVANAPAQLRSLRDRLRFPLVFKPVDASGSRGVRLVPEPSAEEVASAFAYARSFSSSGSVCIEEFVPGREVGGDAVLIDGEIAFAAITEKHFQGFVVTGHNLPAMLSDDDRRRIRGAVEECARAVGYTRGPLNFDVKISPECLVVLEMSARNGGNGIPAIIYRATGVDVEKAAIQFALGEPVVLPPGVDADRLVRRGAASLVFGSRMDGTLRHINDLEQVRELVPELFELNVAVPVGGRVSPFEHNGNLVGCALFDCEDRDRYADIAARIEAALEMRVGA